MDKVAIKKVLDQKFCKVIQLTGTAHAFMQEVPGPIQPPVKSNSDSKPEKDFPLPQTPESCCQSE